MIRSILILLAAAGLTGRAAAQNRQCYRGGTLPACGSFWITEAAYGARVAGALRPFESADGGAWLAAVDFGGMTLVSPRVALGGTVAAGTLGGVYLAVKPRIRYWLTPDWSGDLAPGLVLTGVAGTPRFTADASIMYRNRIGVTAQAFVLPVSVYSPDYSSLVMKKRLTLFAGLRLGSKLGLVGAAADAAALILAFGAYAIACSNNGCD